jgi:hypothetical protein
MLLTLLLSGSQYYGYFFAFLAALGLLFIGLLGWGMRLVIRGTVRDLAIGGLLILAALLLAFLVDYWLFSE